MRPDGDEEGGMDMGRGRGTGQPMFFGGVKRSELRFRRIPQMLNEKVESDRIEPTLEEDLAQWGTSCHQEYGLKPTTASVHEDGLEC